MWGRCGAPDEHAERNMTGATFKTQTAEALKVSEESTSKNRRTNTAVPH